MLGFLKRRKKKSGLCYPMNSCRKFLEYIRSAPNVPEDDLVHDIMRRSGCRVRVDVVDLVRVTRDALK